MEQKKYWQGIEGLLDESKLNAKKKNEFQEDLPILNEVGNIASQTNGSRRDFLKVMGFSLGAATLAASCEIPVKKAIPYVVKPEQVLPGMPTFYASTFVNGSDYCSILVKTREGRPIKIEGNSASSVTQGGTSARVQASVVSLYDGARLRQPVKGGVKASWEAVDKDIAAGLASARGQKVILTGSVVSPSTRQLIQDFSAKYGNVSHVIYEPISQSGITTANQRTFGKKMIPAYHFDKAKVIVGIGCDFLGTWISPVEFTKQYTKNRRIDVSNRTMSKHWQFEGMMSTTGGKADERCTVKPSQEGLVAVALYNELVGGGSSVALDDTVKAKIKKCAADLKANAGRALVVSGSNDADVQEVVNAINQKVGSYGNTIDTSVSYNTHQGDDQAMQKLVSDMNTGNVGALLIYGVNPVYSYPQSDKLISGLQKVGLSVSLNDRIDETGQNVKYICPDNHYLESWGDAEIKTGHYSLIQPTISPLFDTRQAQDSLLTWMGADVSYYDYIQAYWKLNVASKQNKYADFQTFWDNALHDGVVEVGGKSTSVVVPAVAEAAETEGAETEAEEAVVAAPVSGGGDASNAALKVVGKAVKGEELELKLYESVTIGDGRYANNPFLQETPDPITKVCWENILAVSPKYAAEKGWEDYDRIKVKAGGFEVEVPMITQPGQKYGTFALALGYGRTHAGSDFSETGANAYPFVKTGGETFGYAVTSGLSVEKIRASKTY
ncbi:MAG: TAT-variant-translocated molybdopterin oxidoreductase, partial [Chitinophagales bacterium]